MLQLLERAAESMVSCAFRVLLYVKKTRRQHDSTNVCRVSRNSTQYVRSKILGDESYPIFCPKLIRIGYPANENTELEVLL